MRLSIDCREPIKSKKESDGTDNTECFGEIIISNNHLKSKIMSRDFYDDSYEEYDDYECESYDEGGYEWTEEDSWDALTDGMYGDMPSNPLEYDAMMDAMGF